MLDVQNNEMLSKEQVNETQHQYALLADLQLALVGGGGGAASLD